MDIERTDFKRTQRKRRIVLSSIGSLVLVAAGVVLLRLEPVSASADRSDLLIDTVRRGEFVRQVRGPGLLVPKEIRWIVAQAGGRVERIVLRPGAAVEPDSVIAELSNAELERSVAVAEADLAQGQAELAVSRLKLKSEVLDQQARLAQVRAEYESTRLQAEAEAEALRQNAVSQLQARRTRVVAEQFEVRVQVEQDRLTNLRSSIQAQLGAQSARLGLLRTTVERQRVQFASLHVTAGMKGVLQALPVQVGQQLAVGAEIARVAQLDVLIAELKIPEQQAKDLTAGLRAQVDTRNGVVPGRLARVDPAVQNGAVRVEIELEGELPAGARPDLSVDGIIEIERTPDRVFVARPAYGQPDTEMGVFKVDAGGSRARRTKARFGKASVSDIEVIEGLAPGDRIIISDTSQWNSRDVLRIR